MEKLEAIAAQFGAFADDVMLDFSLPARRAAEEKAACEAQEVATKRRAKIAASQLLLRWAMFGSHTKRSGDRSQALVRSLKEVFGMKGHKVFYDEDDLSVITLEALKAEIAKSAIFLVFLDEMTFNSEWCQSEIAFAAQLGVPIYTLIDKDRYPKEVWRSTMAEHGVEGKSIIDMWYGKLGYDVWKTSANHCFGAGSRQAIWYSSDKAGRDAAFKKIEQAIADAGGQGSGGGGGGAAAAPAAPRKQSQRGTMRAFLAFLTQHSLTGLAADLRELGAEAPTDLLEFDDDMVASLRLKPLQVKRWAKMIAALKSA
jgi:hypothetical protein